jgi:heat shock protein HslJ
MRLGSGIRHDKVHRIAQFAAFALSVLAFTSSGAASAPREAGVSMWVLQKGRDIPSPQPRKPTLRMQENKLSGSTGCNNFTATVSQRADKRVAIEEVALTRMLCEPLQNTIETAFVGALRQTEFITRQGSTLTFLSGERSPLLVWKRQQASSSGRHVRQRTAHVRALKRKRAQQRRSVHRAECFFFRWR